MCDCVGFSQIRSHIENTIIPYVKKEWELLGLGNDHNALVLFKCTAKVLKLLEDNHILYVTVPSNCTDRFNPLDLSVNKPAKDLVRTKFQERYGMEIGQQMEKM